MYNDDNLTTLLTKHGFEVVQKAYSCTLSDTPSSVAYALGGSAKMLHWANSLFWAVSLVLDPFLQRFALGDYVTVRAIRRKKTGR
jgi:hypothetical protein